MLYYSWIVIPVLAEVVTRDEEEFVTELRRLPEGWLAVAGLALLGLLCWAVVWMYRYEGRVGATPRVRLILAGIRCAVLLALAVILLEPVRVRILHRWIDSYTVVLVDDSSSMDLADPYKDKAMARRIQTAGFTLPSSDDVGKGTLRRKKLAEEILNRNGRSFLRGLARNNRVKLYTFSDEPHLRGTIRATREKRPRSSKKGKTNHGTGGDTLLSVDEVSTEVTARGSATNIERAVRRSLESLGSAPVAAVVVLSDGGFNQGASAQDTATYARQHHVPLHVVGIGDPSSPTNVRVTEILAPANAFQRDPFSISARLTAEGIDGQTLHVRLLERDARGEAKARIIDTQRVRVGPGGAMEPVTFQRRQSRVGRFVYTVNVPVLEGESVPDDNSRQTTVNVIDARTRVLLIAGGPSWDYRFVSRLLERDDTFDVSCWLQSADLSAVRDGNTIVDHLPTLAEELFKYDVIILMDPSPEELDDSWCRLVDTLVTEYGGGLLFTAARSHTPQFMRDHSLKRLQDLLPVALDPEADIVLNEIGYYQLSASPLDIPTTAYGHPVMRLANDPTSTKLLWQPLQKVYWHYPVLREKAVASVLMRDGDPRMRNSYGPHVLGAVQFVGAGRTGFLGFDGTWRWRRHGPNLFNRFWVQLIRYLAEGKLLGGTKRGLLLTESDEFSLGETVTVTARLLDRQYHPLNRDQVTARYNVEASREEGATLGDFVLTARRDRPGWFEGRFVPDRVGSYRIRVNMPGRTAGDPVEITRDIRITRPNIEILRPQMDRAKLVTLARQSEGGSYFDIDKAGQLPDRIPDLHEEIPIRSRPTSLWDRWSVLAMLITLLTIEWGVRKWNRLL